ASGSQLRASSAPTVSSSSTVTAYPPSEIARGPGTASAASFMTASLNSSLSPAINAKRGTRGRAPSRSRISKAASAGSTSGATCASIWVIWRHRGPAKDIAKMLLDFTIVLAARPNPIVLHPQPFDLIERARHKIHVAADEVGAIAQQRLEHHGGGGIRSPAEEQLGKFCGGKAAALLLGDFPQQLEIEFGGQFGALALQVGEGFGDVFAIGAPIRMAHQDQIARNQRLVSGGIDHGEMPFLFPGDQSSPEPALVEVLDNSAGVFDRR